MEGKGGEGRRQERQERDEGREREEGKQERRMAVGKLESVRGYLLNHK
jgi:hypothetical protein